MDMILPISFCNKYNYNQTLQAMFKIHPLATEFKGTIFWKLKHFKTVGDQKDRGPHLNYA
jgi:hypothetical protein